jgi:GTP 3',8-cyclase
MTVTVLGLPSVSRAVGIAPAHGPLVDTFGRVATDLRVSLTDRCNLRCTYCMPAEGLDCLPGPSLPTRRYQRTPIGLTGHPAANRADR